MPAPLNTRVVLESSASAALLALAYKEKLLTESSKADCCLSVVARKPYPGWLTEQALQQVILFDELHLTKWLPWDGIHGELIESGVFVPVEQKSKRNGVIKTLDPAIVEGILKARGIKTTPLEDPSIMTRTEAALEKIKEWERRYGEKSPDSISLAFSELIERRHPRDSRYSEFKAIDAELDEFRPIGTAIEEYLEMVATAQDKLAHVMTPILSPGSNTLYQPLNIDQEVNAPTVLLRLVCSKLGVLPFGQSLAHTLRLAKDPATIALRNKIQEWTDSLIDGSGSVTENIQREIAKTLLILNAAKTGSTVSNITTYLGIPVALLSTVSAFAVSMGWICSIAGSIGLAASQSVKKKYEWASFGSSNHS